MEQTHTETIKEVVQGLLEKMGCKTSVEVAPERDQNDAFSCMIRIDTDQNLLIGQYGVNLAALQHLVRVILRKKIGVPLSIVVDINDYFSQKRAILEQEAERASLEVLRDKLPVTLRPMPAYERKVVHTFLSLNKEITTESAGKGDERRVIIRPKLSEGEPLAA